MSFAEKIKALRTRRQLTLADVASALGVSRATVSDWENNKQKPRMDRLPLLAQFLGVSQGDLVDEGPLTPEPDFSRLRAEEDDVEIRQFDVGGGMGSGRLLLDEQPGVIKSWHVDQDWLRLNVRNYTAVQNLCIVTGFGPSMRPMFNPGDPLLVDRGVKSVEVDAVYFFRVADHGYIKALQRIPTPAGTLLRAKSKNPDYDSFDIDLKSMDFEVFGKVLTVWRSEQF